MNLEQANKEVHRALLEIGAKNLLLEEEIKDLNEFDYKQKAIDFEHLYEEEHQKLKTLMNKLKTEWIDVDEYPPLTKWFKEL